MCHDRKPKLRDSAQTSTNLGELRRNTDIIHERPLVKVDYKIPLDIIHIRLSIVPFGQLRQTWTPKHNFYCSQPDMRHLTSTPEMSSPSSIVLTGQSHATTSKVRLIYCSLSRSSATLGRQGRSCDKGQRYKSGSSHSFVVLPRRF